LKNIFRLFMVAVIALSLAGCSFLEEAAGTVEYANKAAEHIEMLNAFAEDAPGMIEEAAKDSEIRQQLEERLVILKEDIENFIQLQDIPAAAEAIHEELAAKNEVLLAEINLAIDGGNLALDQLESSEMINTINDASALLNRIEGLMN
jgi:PBP1b-binding outer membrane lipoprotein LpoB